MLRRRPRRRCTARRTLSLRTPERELSESAEDAWRRRPRRRLHSTGGHCPADAERELSESAEDAEKEAAPPLHSTEDIVPAERRGS
ncbi:hypothetical protein TcBrA4_0126350 [Trypanosoma cruzi]|nr:hypothetical protein TcBrA4_0126350 [Trypanosoma cruzi]